MKIPKMSRETWPIIILVGGWFTLIANSWALTIYDRFNPPIKAFQVDSVDRVQDNGDFELLLYKRRQCHLEPFKTQIYTRDAQGNITQGYTRDFKNIALSLKSPFDTTKINVDLRLPELNSAYQVSMIVYYNCQGRLISQAFQDIVDIPAKKD